MMLGQPSSCCQLGEGGDGGRVTDPGSARFCLCGGPAPHRAQGRGAVPPWALPQLPAVRRWVLRSCAPCSAKSSRSFTPSPPSTSWTAPSSTAPPPRPGTCPCTAVGVPSCPLPPSPGPQAPVAGPGTASEIPQPTQPPALLRPLSPPSTAKATTHHVPQCHMHRAGDCTPPWASCSKAWLPFSLKESPQDPT